MVIAIIAVSVLALVGLALYTIWEWINADTARKKRRDDDAG